MTVLTSAHAEPHTTIPAVAGGEATMQEAVLDVRQTLRSTGLLTWAALSLHSLLIEPVRDHLSREAVLSWGGLNVLFILLFLFTMSRLGQVPLRQSLGLLALETSLLLYANSFLNGSSIQAGLLVVVAAQVSLLLRFRQALAWVVIQSVGLFWVLYLQWDNIDAIAFSTGYLCIQLLAATSVRTAMREVTARRQLVLVVEELRTTRELLNQASRQAERLHISRELHDVLGHHLTALGMHLQVGLHLLPENSPARPHVQTAQGVAQQLLGDVRATVRGMRASATCDFPSEVRELVQGISLPVQVHFSEGFSVPCPVQVMVLRRCVQEILTNAVRHAQATQVWLAFHRDVQGLTLTARDDGRGAPHLRFGCGLMGMQERLSNVGGQLQVDSPPGQGVRYRIHIPLKETA